MSSDQPLSSRERERERERDARDNHRYSSYSPPPSDDRGSRGGRNKRWEHNNNSPSSEHHRNNYYSNNRRRHYNSHHYNHFNHSNRSPSPLPTQHRSNWSPDKSSKRSYREGGGGRSGYHRGGGINKNFLDRTSSSNSRYRHRSSNSNDAPHHAHAHNDAQTRSNSYGSSNVGGGNIGKKRSQSSSRSPRPPEYSDTSSGYIHKMGYMKLDGGSNCSSQSCQDHHDNDNDGIGDDVDSEHDQKPAAITESNKDEEDLRYENQNSVEKDGYYSSGAMSDGNISTCGRRSAFSGGGSSTGSVGTRAHSTDFPHHAGYYQSSEACKSDIATICSGSMMDEMEIASVLSGDMNQPSSSSGGVAMSAPIALARSGSFSAGRKSSLLNSSINSSGEKISGGVEFPSVSGVERHVSMQEPPMILNDMGPPVSRIIIARGVSNRNDSIGDGHSSASGGVPSDLVTHLGTDDGGSIAAAEIDNHSAHSSTFTREYSNMSEEQAVSDAPESAERVDSPRPTPFTDAVPQAGSGRISPGGTVYKGRGVRRYQGRYMNLPLKRFQQNGGAAEEDTSPHLLHHRDSDPDWVQGTGTEVEVGQEAEQEVEVVIGVGIFEAAV
eukprot:CAMPEP_0116031936 /NCGR_PEP_ID=MMETSP0321-20121206/17852_1 /TAXON_ID=163516 /ORGANISM="Leptocylindrus danicus var. danicus, Strain B650" /LENGTH=607 /DNA_ID=CAMNT_0003507239 /DNA_START=190 /DNA_END=2014 /DNA_ORIENTATION=-